MNNDRRDGYLFGIGCSKTLSLFLFFATILVGISVLLAGCQLMLDQDSALVQDTEPVPPE
jgi:hypothetical protein